jgi:hypothetical protein
VAFVGSDGIVRTGQSGLATLIITSGQQSVDVHVTVTP